MGSRLVRDLGISTLAAIHDLNLAAAHCDRIYELRAGRMVAAGTPADILDAALIAEVFNVRAEVVHNPVTGKTWLAFSPESRVASSNGHGHRVTVERT